jgi:hypothetical protein
MMAECCCAGPDTSNASGPLACGACGTAGKPVDSLTIKALLTESALRRLEAGAYRFCPDSTCDVVYFAEDATTTFSTRDLRVPVWQKEPAGHRMVCYCFGETERDMTEEIDRTGTSLAADRVRSYIAAGRCACDVRNPKGACLGDVIAAVDRLRRTARSRP